MSFSRYIIFWLLLFFVFFYNACKKDALITDSSAKITFSADTVFFDTVFSSVGSTTKVFKIYNPYGQKILISKACVTGGSSSPFRINIDGDSGPSINDIELLPNDSLFVFVQVTVNPAGVNTPLLVTDAIVFETNGNQQTVLLTAIGQDVYLHKPTVFPTNGLPPYSLINCSAAWTNDKPHLIIGYAVVDTDSTLQINAGTKIYMNKGAVLWVYRGGSLKINGSKGNEVKIQGARLEEDYRDIAGQWGKIWMMAGSKNNEVNWAIIKNGSIGIQADSLGDAGAPLLCLSNTIIKNMSSAALYAKQAHIRSYNCVLANCGQYVAALSSGGNYSFTHCTFANYWSNSSRTTPLLLINNYYIKNTYYFNKNLDSAYFGNCIIHGSLDNEVALDSSTNVAAGTFHFKFENTIIKTPLAMANDGIRYVNVLKNYVPGFVDVSKDNYQLSSSSQAIDKGFVNGIIYDLNNQIRPNPGTAIPDLGAYEHY